MEICNPNIESQILQKFMVVVDVNNSHSDKFLLDKPENDLDDVDSTIASSNELPEEEEDKEEEKKQTLPSVKNINFQFAAPLGGPPKIPELQLNTITLVNTLDRRFNLDILSKYIQISENYTGMLSYNGVLTGKKTLIEQKPKRKRQSKKIYNNESTSLKEAEDVKTCQIPTPSPQAEAEAEEEVRGDLTGESKAPTDPNETISIVLGNTPKSGKRSFDNQNTFYHLDKETSSILNVKLFNNGMIVLVGCKETEKRPHQAILDLIPILRCEGEVTVEVLTNLEKYLIKDQSAWKQKTSRMIPGFKLLAKAINTYLKLDDGKKIPEDLADITFPPITKIQPKSMIDPILAHKLLFLFTVHKILQIYYLDPFDISYRGFYDQFITGKIQKRFEIDVKKAPNDFIELLRDICDGWDGHSKFDLYLKSYMNPEIPLKYDPSLLRIGLINMGLELGFNVDRSTITQLISTKYNHPARFDPDMYQGVIVTYQSDAECFMHNPNSAKEPPTRYITQLQIEHNKKTGEKKCSCKSVTILIYREGGLIITGPQSWKQTKQAYDFVEKFVLNEYEHIKTHFELKAFEKKQKKVPIALKHGEFTYLSKAHILSNPRNFLLIKKLGIEIR